MEAIRNSGVFPNKTQAEKIKEYSGAGQLSSGQVYEVLLKKADSSRNVTISEKKIRSYFPDGYSKMSFT